MTARWATHAGRRAMVRTIEAGDYWHRWDDEDEDGAPSDLISSEVRAGLQARSLDYVTDDVGCRVVGRAGRPPLSDEPTVKLTVKLPQSVKAAAKQAADDADEDLSDVVRAGIERELAVRARRAKRG